MPHEADGSQLRVVAPKGLSGALTRYRIMAWITGVVLAIMTCVLVFKALSHTTPPGYSFGWIAHGWMYIIYVAAALDLVFRLRWNLGRALLIMIAGTIPFMSFVAERYVTNRVRPIVEQAAAPVDHAAADSLQR